MLSLLTLTCACAAPPTSERAREASVVASAPDVAEALPVPAAPWRGTVEPVVAALPAVWPAGAWWISAGGGATPESNQVSIEQDLGLARETFGAAGLLLFAGGRGSHGVQVEAKLASDPLRMQLADLFAPRGGREASYRPTALAVDGAATAENLRAAIERAMASGETPLLLYLAGHGQRGQSLAEATIDLWGQVPVSAREVAELLDGRTRPVRLVITSCFSGGFAELVFVAADATRGPAAGRCGLFAATAEREASGCDPNPDRAAQEGYGLHFLSALRGLDRAGQPADIDLDGDGRVSLLEAHTRARVASAGIDVPTTTSERWLRSLALRGRAGGFELPEEAAVIEALTRELGLVGRTEEAAKLLAEVEAEAMAVSDRTVGLADAEDAAYRRTASELLARWPVLDDAWHPDFAAMLASEGPEISAALASSAAYAAYLTARAEIAGEQDKQAALLARSAKLERLVRALETSRQAGVLAQRGGADWRAYQALLACERWVPPLGTGTAN